MSFRQNRLLGVLVAVGLAAQGLGGCSSNGQTGTGGTTSTGSGGASSGGSNGSGGSASGGSTSSGGAPGTGGSVSTGGSSSGGTTSSGGSASGGSASGGSASGGSASGGSASGGSAGGSASGGAAGGAVKGSGGAQGGKGGTVASSGGAGGMSSSGSGGSSGTCQKGLIKANDVVVLGESFYAMGNIVTVVEAAARKAGAIGSSDKYRNLSVSGQPMSYIASTEWDKAVAGGVPKLVIMDGGGIDCLGGGCSTCSTQFKALLTKMGTAGVQDVIYTRYPEPGAPPGSNTSLKACLDSVMPMMQPVCEASTSPKCHWLDLRPVWVAGDTTDGLHATQSGSDHVGALIWSEMMKLCLGQ